MSRPTIYKCIDKVLAAGVEAGLEDRYHRAKEPVITEESKAWVLSLGDMECFERELHEYVVAVEREGLAEELARLDVDLRAGGTL